MMYMMTEKEHAQIVDALASYSSYKIQDTAKALAMLKAMQPVSQEPIAEILTRLANEPPISGNHMAQTRVLLAADWYKKAPNLDTSQERVQKLTESNQMLLEVLKKAVSRQGFSNDELIEARAAIAAAEKGATP
jgi:hypothetical protein